MSNNVNFFILAAFFLFGAIFKGYYFDTALLFMNALVILGFSILLFLQKSLTVTWLHIPLVLFVACYWIACLYAVDLESAILEASRVTSLIPLSLIVTMLPRQRLTQLYSLGPWLGILFVAAGVLFQMERNGRLEPLLY
ncbi:hypothetical protein [Paenibacillus sp. YIM B09110]|uniref:hypothetical protein n=1 Tax=Paenibacillus sp. YIM B09110 TaxID=3126102 RepID=UPI00301B8A13